MKRARSLEATLLLRLGLVLVVAFSTVALWLRFHLGASEGANEQPIAHRIMEEFFADIAWTVPIVLIVTLAVTALTLRRSLRPLRDISQKATSIRPGTLEQRLPEAGVPAEVLPLLRATNDMLDRVEAGFAAQRRFTANAAHELRTPLQLLASGLEALGADPRIEPLREDVRRMSRLVAELLAVARLDARTEPVLGTVDLAETVAESLSFLAPLALAERVNIGFERPAEAVVVRGERALIGDLARNLIENALAAAPKGSEVSVVVATDGRLEVADRGPGIKPEYRERVLERFWRAPDAPAAGTGLGLAIVKEIAEACGARISIGDAPGGGAVVGIAFARVNP